MVETGFVQHRPDHLRRDIGAELLLSVRQMKAGKGKVVGGIKEQTRQTLEDIKNSLELMGATLKHIVMFRYFLKRREDVFDMRDEMYKFFEENEPDLRAHPRPATLIRGVGIDLPDMLIEIEAWAAVPRKK